MQNIFIKKDCLGAITPIIIDVLKEYGTDACVLMVSKVENIEYGDYCISLACTEQQKNEIDARLIEKTAMKKRENRHKPFKREDIKRDVSR